MNAATPDPLTADSDAIIEALTGKYTTKENHVPQRIVPPAAFVALGPIDRQDGDPFGHLTPHYEVWIVTGQAPNEEATNSLKRLIFKELVALHAEGFTLEGVDEPFTYQIQNGHYLSTIIRVSSGVDLR